MDRIRLEFADRINELSLESYHNNTTKVQKAIDKKKLDSDIEKARIPLLKIMKLTIEDLHRGTQMSITNKLSLKDSLKSTRYNRKAMLSKVKSKILSAYRENQELDIPKYAKETQISIED